MKMDLAKILFLVGIIGAIIVGLLEGVGAFSTTDMIIPTILALVGLGIGFMNITKKESTDFMIAVLMLLAAGTGASILSAFGLVTGVIGGIMKYLGIVLIPAGVVVGLKVIWEKSK